jgi:predicted DNA-binding transcriptional regulator AlpA
LSAILLIIPRLFLATVQAQQHFTQRDREVSDSDLQCSIPKIGYLRLKQIIGDPKAKPPIPAIVPVGKSTWWKWMQEGRAPASVKLGPRVTAWRSEDILRFLECTQN